MSNKPQTLTITVEGRAHTGKSTVMAIVEKAMKDAGYEDVEIQSINNEPGVGFNALPVAIARTRVNKIVITEKMASYSGSESSPVEPGIMPTTLTPVEIKAYSDALDKAIEHQCGDALDESPNLKETIKTHFMRLYLAQKVVVGEDGQVKPAEKHWSESLPAGAVFGAFPPNNGA